MRLTISLVIIRQTQKKSVAKCVCSVIFVVRMIVGSSITLTSIVDVCFRSYGIVQIRKNENKVFLAELGEMTKLMGLVERPAK
jgi:UTP-glucose-1-phosphate uridylyltransferase